MKKAWAALLCVACLCLGVSGCGGKAADIALVPDAGGVEDASFNQGTWEGIWLYSNVHMKTSNYYTPARDSASAYAGAVKNAVNNGAEVVFVSGAQLADAAAEAQAKYPGVSFVMMDAEPTGGPADNTVAVTFAEEQAGYLAGWAAVQEGYTSLGFLGGRPVPGVVRYGYGYVQGAAAAAQALKRPVQMRYAYTEGFVESEQAWELARGWYEENCEVIFACGGAQNLSVFAAAEAAGGKTIGVDVDQSGVSPTVITSAVKSTGAAATQLLEEFYGGAFPGGSSVVMGVADSAVGLSMPNSRFEVFTQNDYDRLLNQMAKGELGVLRDDEVAGEGVSPEGLPGLDKLELQYTGP